MIGGGTKIKNIISVAKKQLRLPAVLGTNSNIDSVIDKVNETEFLNALGLVAWGSQVYNGGSGLRMPGGAIVEKGVEKLKKMFKSLVP
ncbi:hypothetical protein C0583_06300 [Candidatus Parcubacteria bacterium]|nr:MAG: hypothetical protein C0583_06300 [Candidatus Parcubacteria bacterium]